MFELKAVLLTLCVVYAQKLRQNVILILTDDQDLLLNGMAPMVKTKSLVADQGVTFMNAFVTTPVCCPSRASILTGKYVHNHRVTNNTVEGGCSGMNWINGSEQSTIAVYLQNAGYSTFYAGKYLNMYGEHGDSWKRVPPGWQWWYGLVGNSVYYNYSLSVNGTTLERHGDKPQDYLTNVILKKVSKFLKLASKSPNRPFFTMLCPPAPHSPFEPYFEYKDMFDNITAPRTPNFDIHSSDKHWLVRRTPKNLNANLLKRIDDVHKNRWRTLLSVDDLVESIIDLLKRLKIYDETYIIYSSDNGYHLGQFCLPLDKRQLYEFDVRIPMIVSGPGLCKAKKIDNIVLNIDIAPTILEMANVSDMITNMDGKSFFKLLSDERRGRSKKWRKNFLIEYWGEANRGVSSQCPQMKNLAECHIDEECICQDSVNNTYKCVREINSLTNFVFCRFADDERFVEAYDLTKDAFQLINLAEKFKVSKRRYYERKLSKLSKCHTKFCP